MSTTSVRALAGASRAAARSTRRPPAVRAFATATETPGSSASPAGAPPTPSTSDAAVSASGPSSSSSSAVAYAPVLPSRSGELNGAEAAAYLSSILSLPPDAFPPELALQILTHKSFRFVHRLSHPPPYSDAELAQSQVSHNGRLSFIGRRAIAAYSAMFVHSALPTTGAVHAADFLRGKDLQGKLDALRHSNNLGRCVGDRWRIQDVMRWDQNATGDSSHFAKLKGLTVEAVLGGVFTQLGSPAAQRAYHLHVLPHVAPQLRDPALIEAAERVRDSAQRLGGVA